MFNIIIGIIYRKMSQVSQGIRRCLQDNCIFFGLQMIRCDSYVTSVFRIGINVKQIKKKKRNIIFHESVTRNLYSDCVLLKSVHWLDLLIYSKGEQPPPLPPPSLPPPLSPRPLLPAAPPFPEQLTLGGTRVIVLDHSHYFQSLVRQPCKIAADTSNKLPANYLIVLGQSSVWCIMQ